MPMVFVCLSFQIGNLVMSKYFIYIFLVLFYHSLKQLTEVTTPLQHVLDANEFSQLGHFFLCRVVHGFFVYSIMHEFYFYTINHSLQRGCFKRKKKKKSFRSLGRLSSFHQTSVNLIRSFRKVHLALFLPLLFSLDFEFSLVNLGFEKIQLKFNDKRNHNEKYKYFYIVNLRVKIQQRKRVKFHLLFDKTNNNILDVLKHIQSNTSLSELTRK